MNAEPLLELRDVAVSFGETKALDGVDLTVASGELLVLLGPSGCGKSTLLRAVAGLQPLERGVVVVAGRDQAGRRPDERGIGLMFQDDVLFPHFDVAGNVEFGLRMQGWERPQRRRRVAEMLALVGLSGFERRDVATLSGGEAQRVGLARALAPRPRLVLLDEPFGALDRPLRERLVDELGPLLAAQRVTTVHVTHDHSEAFALGHRVAVMSAGAPAAVGTPEEIWTRPRTVGVARFLGHRNTFGAREWERLTGGVHRCPDGTHVAVRADLIGLRRAGAAPAGTGVAGAARLSGTVAARRFTGDRYEIRVRLDAGEPAVSLPAVSLPTVSLEVRTEHGPGVGTRVGLEIPAAALVPLSE